MRRQHIHILHGGREAEQFLNAGGVILDSRTLKTDFRENNCTLDATLGSRVRCVEFRMAFRHPDIC